MTESTTTETIRAKLDEHFESGEIREGNPIPWGTHQHGDGVNFAIFSRNATRVHLEFYQNANDATPSRVIDLDPVHHRTGDVWHVWVRGVPSGQLYGYRFDGPYEPEHGHRFNPHKLLLDPFATSLAGVRDWNFAAARGYDSHSSIGDLSFSAVDNAGTAPKSVFCYEHFDWEGDRPSKIAPSDTIIYEAHVRGFTIDRSAAAASPGTFLGLIEKIPYLQDLGVTAIELMPVAEFNENEVVRVNPVTQERLKNFWGYNPAAFFAPKQSYASLGAQGRQTVEFREMVKAFHRAGMEVILDVVLNHTAEGKELGPTISLRGMENSIFYMLEENGRYYRNYSGVGNTLNANHPVVRELVMASLRYWVMYMHVDGFRFDLASILGRDRQGNILNDAPLLDTIAEDGILHNVKIIAEAWDAGGAYQVGTFSRGRWAEWNGRFRDDVRRFWLGDAGMMAPFASRICGSADVYEASGRGPESSLNFITSHDGFTLNDLVSYREKHNDENGEFGRDGTDANYSDNCGVEGPSNSPAVEGLRERLIKTFLTTLLVSRGMPMLLGGDEFRRTQRGNNNAYCQDNEISWIDWTLLEKHKTIHRFAKAMIAFRKAHAVLRTEEFYTDAEIRWFGANGGAPDWGNDSEKSFACLIFGQSGPDLLLMFNAAPGPVDFSIPAAPEKKVWRLAIDTARPSPEDIYDVGKEPSMQDQVSFRLEPRSVAILLAR